MKNIWISWPCKKIAKSSCVKPKLTCVHSPYMMPVTVLSTSRCSWETSCSLLVMWWHSDWCCDQRMTQFERGRPGKITWTFKRGWYVQMFSHLKVVHCSHAFYVFTRESCQHLALTLAVEKKGEAHGIEQLTHYFAMWSHRCLHIVTTVCTATDRRPSEKSRIWSRGPYERPFDGSGFWQLCVLNCSLVDFDLWHKVTVERVEGEIRTRLQEKRFTCSALKLKHCVCVCVCASSC